MQTGHDAVSFTEIAPHENASTVRHSLRLGLMRSTCRVLLIFPAICIRLISSHSAPFLTDFFFFFLFFWFLVLIHESSFFLSFFLKLAVRTSSLFFSLLEVKVDDNVAGKLVCVCGQIINSVGKYRCYNKANVKRSL